MGRYSPPPPPPSLRGNLTLLAHSNETILPQVSLLLAWVFFYLFVDELPRLGKNRPQDYEDWYAFFFFVHLIGWLMIILFFIIFTCGLERILGFAKCWWFLVRSQLISIVMKLNSTLLRSCHMAKILRPYLAVFEPF